MHRSNDTLLVTRIGQPLGCYAKLGGLDCLMLPKLLADEVAVALIAMRKRRRWDRRLDCLHLRVIALL